MRIAMRVPPSSSGERHAGDDVEHDRQKVEQRNITLINQLLRLVARGLLTILSTKDVQKTVGAGLAFPLCSAAFSF